MIESEYTAWNTECETWDLEQERCSCWDLTESHSIGTSWVGVPARWTQFRHEVPGWHGHLTPHSVIEKK